MSNLKKAKVAVLVSGGGTNLQAIIDAVGAGIIKNAEISLVVSNNPNAYALTRAENAGIVTKVISKRECGTQEVFEGKLIDTLTENGIELIVLAGFMSILSADFTKRYERRIINVHPSLIPSFCGKGFYGLHVHEAALEKGVRVSGATVHIVTPECDAGPIVLQKAVEVKQDDTPEILQKRIMEEAEWKILPEAVKLFCEDRITVKENKVYIKGEQA